jgi:signal transduction histidine kinase/CheY-like chemotaxis protein
MYLGRIQIRLILLISVISILFTIALFIENKNQISQINDYASNYKHEKSIWLDEVIKLKSENIESFTFDYTYWDEMVTFINKKDKQWAYTNIIPSFTKYNIQYNWTFDKNFNLVFSSDIKGRKIPDFPPIQDRSFRIQLQDKYFSHFFIEINNEFIEIFSAPIQPTADTGRKTTPLGYFFTGRVWNNKLLNSLEELTGSKIKMEKVSDQLDYSFSDKNDTIIIAKQFYSYNGDALKAIIFYFSPATVLQYQESAGNQLINNFIFVIVIICALALFLFYSIVKPIRLLSDSIKTEQFDLLEPLMKSRTEFKQLAKLIHEYTQQKNRLQLEITEKIRVADKLGLSETKYRTLFENMVNGLSLNEIMLDSNNEPRDYRILEMNSAMEFMLHIKKEEVIGKTINEVNSEWKHKDIIRFGTVAITGKPLSFESFDRELNKYFYVTVFCPKHLLFAVILEDINERKLSEIALQNSNTKLEAALKELKETHEQLLMNERLKSLGQMASGIAHDINNSLAPILGFSDLLLKNNDNQHISKQLGMIKTASLDIKKTIEHLREFYRPRENKELSDFLQLNKVIKSAIELTRHRWKSIPEAEGKTIVIKTDMDRNLPFIKGNESEIRESLTNLIINASDAVKNDGILIFKTYTSNQKVILELIDNGSGMDKNTKAHCLDPFYSTKGEKGTGMGLSMVYGIIQRHGGELQIESEPGEGTIIRLLFPAENEQTENIPFDEIRIIPALNILCVDDDPIILETLSNILTENNHKVSTFTNGEDGILAFIEAMSSDNSFNLVISDLGMPKMDGREVARSIKTLDPNIPIILLTGWGSFLDDDDIKEVDYILSKPITLEDINKALRNIFKI